MKNIITLIISLSVTVLLVVSCAANVQPTKTTTDNDDDDDDSYDYTTTYTPIDPATSTSAVETSDSPSLGTLLLSSLASNAESLTSSLISAVKDFASKNGDGDCQQCSGNYPTGNKNIVNKTQEKDKTTEKKETQQNDSDDMAHQLYCQANPNDSSCGN